MNRTFFHDDAYITLRYARNLLAGHGVVWNPGERVQGYTSGLQLGLVSLCGLAGLDLRLAARLIGILSMAALLGGLLWLPVRLRVHRNGPLWVMPVTLTATSCPMIVWSLSGMETVLFSLLVASGCVLFVLALESMPGIAPEGNAEVSRSRRSVPAEGSPVMTQNSGWSTRLLTASGCCFGLSFTARPEGALFALVSFAWLLLPTRSNRLRSSAVFAGACLAPAIPYMVWQLLYYGSVIPNTYYAKVSGLPAERFWLGWKYVLGYVVQPPYMALALMALLLAGVWRRIWRVSSCYLLSIVLVYWFYVIAVGGDHMKAWRFMVPSVTPLACLLYLLLGALVRPGDRRALLVTFVLLLVLPALQLLSRSLNPRREDTAALVGTAVGKYIDKAWPAGSLVALNTAGSTPYYAPNLRFVDMLGLNDAHIARRKVERLDMPGQQWPGHMKGDGAYVLDRRPDYIIMGPADGKADWNKLFLSEYEMTRDSRLGANYQAYAVWLDASGNRTEPSRHALCFCYFQRVRR